MWYVYIIKSKIKRWYYVGSTNRFPERMDEYNKGLVISTKHYLPFKCVFRKEFVLEKDARGYERMLKDKRIEKEKLVRMIENN